MGRVGVFLYGVGSYVLALAVFAYTAGFIGNFMVPRSLDAAPVGSFGTSLLVDLGLLVLFALQHSVMARPGFKRVLTRLIPQAAERSTYVLASSVAMFLLFWQWRPLGGVLWSVDSTAGRVAIYSLYAFGWALLLASTFVINHFDLFGLRQVWLQLLGRPYTKLRFATPVFYRLVRHPLYIGWMTIFWATPVMSAAHLLFAAVTTGYILVAIKYEERDLVDMHPEYADYRRRVPMLNPFGRRPATRPVSAAAA
jgi:methanethiol S-methyltransferase